MGQRHINGAFSSGPRRTGAASGAFLSHGRAAPCVRWWVLAILLLPLASAQDGGSPLDATQRDWLDDHGSVRVGVQSDAAPTSFLLNGTHFGWGVDLVSLAALKVGAKIEFVHYQGETALVQALRAGEVDVAGPLGPRSDVQAFAQATTPFGWTPVSFITVDRSFVDVDDIQGRVSAIPGSSMERLLRDAYPHLEYVHTANVRQGIGALAIGELDAYLGPLPVIGHEAQEQGVVGLRPVGGAIEVLEESFFGRDLVPLSIIEDGRQRISRSEASITYVKWTGFDLGPPASDPPAIRLPDWVGITLTAMGLVLVVTFGSIVVLRRLVAERTEELHLLNQDLDRQVRQRTSQLAEVNEELKGFVRAASHDLRAPVRHMTNYAELAEMDPEDAPHHLERIRKNGERLSDMLDALLVLSRASNAPMKRQRVDLSEAARGIIASLEEDDERDVDVSIEEDIVVEGDPELLRIALLNLLGNAWKYTGKDARIRVVQERTEDTVRVSVIDNGKGFDPDLAERMFQPFQRLEVHGEVHGQGIGLATVRRIAVRHGGDVRAEGRPGKGAAFTLELPASAVEERVEATGA